MRPDWGIFKTLLATNFRTNVFQIFADFLCYFEKLHLQVKTALAIFGKLLAYIGLLFGLPSGHTVLRLASIHPTIPEAKLKRVFRLQLFKADGGREGRREDVAKYEQDFSFLLL